MKRFWRMTQRGGRTMLAPLDRVLLLAVLTLQVLLLSGRLRPATTAQASRRPDVPDPTSRDAPPERASVPPPPPAGRADGWFTRMIHAGGRPVAVADERLSDMRRGWERIEASPGLDVVDASGGFEVLFSLPAPLLEPAVLRVQDGILSIHLTFRADAPEGAAEGGRLTGHAIRRLQLPGIRRGVWTPEAVVTNGLLRIWVPKENSPN